MEFFVDPHSSIKKNIHFLETNTIDSENKNPYGENVTSKILKLLEN